MLKLLGLALSAVIVVVTVGFLMHIVAIAPWNQAGEQTIPNIFSNNSAGSAFAGTDASPTPAPPAGSSVTPTSPPVPDSTPATDPSTSVSFIPVDIPVLWTTLYPIPDADFATATSSKGNMELTSPVAEREAAQAWVDQMVSFGWTLETVTQDAASYSVSLRLNGLNATVEVIDAPVASSVFTITSAFSP